MNIQISRQKMTKIYFAGQDNFGNRGCEALVRSNVKTLKQHIPAAIFLVPTRNVERDAPQWAAANDMGVKFIAAEPIPSAIRWWSRGRRVFSALDAVPPSYRVTQATRYAILSSDALVMTGGDIISLDYGLESLYYWSRICEIAMDAGVPTVLWGASVGPFGKTPSAERRMRAFLRRFSLITVRETSSLEYLRGLGMTDVQLVTDSAFALEPESFPEACVSLFAQGKPVLGFNVSPLIRKFRDSEERRNELDREVIEFLCDVLREGQMPVLLIPHVDPLDGTSENSDSAYMNGILAKVREAGFGADSIDILPRTLNASQLKGVISQCAFFMGARTHATVASLSQCVPTTSIAYSIKAKGINNDLFGHTRYVLETPSVTRHSLREHLELLRVEKAEIISLLNERMPLWKRNASRSAELLAELLMQPKPVAA
ncbi:MAG: polysaccharide pyruvyl transferase family protein [Gammaproteobacteria bacterium]|nr:polysaccharide pyruvyl transferase family protein [Gammaproteobacteria bacterium]MBU2435905.1 polysaccharide pyruvyl transferase family protein [Gammaproteobacteria bacterium]MBU2449314.1 polysaccharide pyruvyl transferase family protein [Gammaproteobacteria bacterium]